MKKHVIIALILVLTATMLAGCRNPNNTMPTTAATTTAPMTQPTTAVTTMPTSLPETSNATVPHENNTDGTGNTIGESGTIESGTNATDATGNARNRSRGGMQSGR